MRRSAALLCVCFCAGMLGILAAAGGAWLWARTGWPGLGGWPLQPLALGDGFCARLLSGGLWGMLFFLCIGAERARTGWIRKGLLLGLVPALLQVLLLFPQLREVSLQGAILRPLLLILLNLLWGGSVGLATRLLWGRG